MPKPMRIGPTLALWSKGKVFDDDEDYEQLYVFHLKTAFILKKLLRIVAAS